MKIKIISYILHYFLKCFQLTYRFEIVNPKILDDIEQELGYRSFIFAIWHQNFLSAMMSYQNNPVCNMASRSKDGEIAAINSKLFGFTPVRGSSSRGGTKAKDAMIKMMTEDQIPGAITIDGPKGPVCEVKRGVIEIAKETGVPIIPHMSFADSYWVFEKAWDKFRFPKPFAKIIVLYGDPIWVHPDLSEDDLKDLKEEVRSSIFSLEAKAKQMLDK